MRLHQRFLPVVPLLISCSSILDVENPNNVTDDDVRNGDVASLWVSGARRAVQIGWDRMLERYAIASDELTYTASFGELESLDRGNVSDQTNEQLAIGFRELAAATWMAREAIFVLDSVNSAHPLQNPDLLAEAYLYGAMVVSLFANWFEDMAFSDRGMPGPAIGEENMFTLYEKAADYIDTALNMASAVSLQRDLLALRAKANHERAIWDRLGVLPADLSDGGLSASAPATADARAALAMDPTDWRYNFNFSSTELDSKLGFTAAHPAILGQIGDRYIERDSTGRINSVALMDPVDTVPAPAIGAIVFGSLLATQTPQFVSLTVFSARELHLIVAEDALANADTLDFQIAINAVRAMDDLTPWTPASGVAARAQLIYERQANLFLQGHRLNDMYRFGITSDEWSQTSVAVQAPGTMFPIPLSEVQANCHLNPEVNCT